MIVKLALQLWYDTQDSTSSRRMFKRHKRDVSHPIQSSNDLDNEDSIVTILATMFVEQGSLLFESNLSILEWEGRIQGEWYVKPRSLHWWNHYNFLVKCDDHRFCSIFRLPHALFQSLCELLHEDLSQGHIPYSLATSIKSRVLPVEKQVAIAVLQLSSSMTMININELFGCGKSTVVRTIRKFIDVLMLWPTDSIALECVKEGFCQKRGFPNCCGAIDVTHIRFESSSDWYDRDHNYSMVLQAIVDSNMRFMDVFTSWPGSINDARLLRNSSFNRLCGGGERLNGPSICIGLFDMREYIIGDGGYPLLPWLITPFSGVLTNSQREFNFKLFSTRIIVECAFRRLKNSWRILHTKLCHPNLQLLPQTILVCCILHNMLLSFGEEDNDLLDDIAEIEENVQGNEVTSGDPTTTVSRNG
eukprot:Gb_09563 [translate_table: standard]